MPQISSPPALVAAILTPSLPEGAPRNIALTLPNAALAMRNLAETISRLAKILPNPVEVRTNVVRI